MYRSLLLTWVAGNANPVGLSAKIEDVVHFDSSVSQGLPSDDGLTLGIWAWMDRYELEA